jgi:hypothetical protein
MQANVTKEITVVISLSEKEAIWLKDYVQNFLKTSEYEESDESKQNRMNLFNLLKKELGG